MIAKKLQISSNSQGKNTILFRIAENMRFSLDDRGKVCNYRHRISEKRDFRQMTVRKKRKIWRLNAKSKSYVAKWRVATVNLLQSADCNWNYIYQF